MAKDKKSKSRPSFLGLPHAVLDCPAYIELPNAAKVLLVDIGRQFNGFNNGDLSCTLSLMQKRSWKSKSQLDKAKAVLLEKGFIALTREGGRNRCNLYCLTWQKIDEHKGKLDRPATKAPLSYWRQGFNPELQQVGGKVISLPLIQAKATPYTGLVSAKAQGNE